MKTYTEALKEIQPGDDILIEGNYRDEQADTVEFVDDVWIYTLHFQISRKNGKAKNDNYYHAGIYHGNRWITKVNGRRIAEP